MNGVTARAAGSSAAHRWLIAGFAVAIVLQLELVFNRPINWDEFLHLSETHAFQQGRLDNALQNFYARVFFWVPLLPFDPVNQLRVTRLFMFGCELFTTAAIFGMARRFVPTAPAAAAALAYLTAGYVFQHGFSYRADPMAAAFLMGALWIVLVSKLRLAQIFGAAVLIGLAALTTIKVAFYAPAFLGVAWLRWHEADRSRETMLRLLAVGFLSALFALLFLGLTMATLPAESSGNVARTMSSSGGVAFREGFFPRWPYLVGAIATGPVMALLVVTAPLEIVRAKVERHRWIALAGLMLPLSSVLVYRNSFPYFYAFILPPVMVAAAVSAQALLNAISAWIVAAALVACAVMVSATTPRPVLQTQREVVDAVHEIFPAPVAYFDFPGMIADFPKANFFMSTWGVMRYRDGAMPSFVEVMAQKTVPLLLLDQEALERNQTASEPAWELLPQDGHALREGFIPHWGPVWVAGRRFAPQEAARGFTIYAPGTYTLEGAAARIDGADYSPGDTITLARGTHAFERMGKGETVLRWGDHLKQPAAPFSGGPLFSDF